MIQKAIPYKSKLRLAISGGPGSGKTYTSLRVGKSFVDKLMATPHHFGNGRIGLIDTDKGKSSLYAKMEGDDESYFDFDIITLKTFSPESMREALAEFESSNYTLIILDTATPEWNGRGGTLDIHDQIVAKKGERHSFFAWKDVKPRHRNFVDMMLGSSAHIICNMRARVKIVVNGQTFESIGMRPIQDKEIEHEFDANGMMDISNTIEFRKSRFPLLNKKRFKLPGEDLAQVLIDSILRGKGEPRAPEVAVAADVVKDIRDAFQLLNASPDSIRKAAIKYGANSGRLEDLGVSQAYELQRNLVTKVGNKGISDQIESSLATGPSPSPESVINGDELD